MFPWKIQCRNQSHLLCSAFGEETGLCSSQGGQGSLAIALTIFCPIFQMRRAVNPNHWLRCCPMRPHLSCRHCLSAAEGTVLPGPCRTLRIYIHMCLFSNQGQQVTMIRVSRDPTTDFVGEPQSVWVRGRMWDTETLPLTSPWSPSLWFRSEGVLECSIPSYTLEPCYSLVQGPAALIFVVS